MWRAVTFVVATNYCAGGSLAATFQDECPAEIAQKSVRIAGLPSPWSQFVQDEAPVPAPTLTLAAVGLTYGPPSARAEMKPDVVKNGGATWRDLDKGVPAGGLWMECKYGPGEFILLGRQLPAGIRQCALTHAAGKPAGLRCE